MRRALVAAALLALTAPTARAAMFEGLFAFADKGNAVKNRAMVELFAILISAARKAKRVQPAVKKPENEKYYFRSWLLRIGMGTKASHESRMALLKGLKGWSAFRTEEEAKAHARKQKERRHQNP